MAKLEDEGLDSIILDALSSEEYESPKRPSIHNSLRTKKRSPKKNEKSVQTLRDSKERHDPILHLENRGSIDPIIKESLSDVPKNIKGKKEESELKIHERKSSGDFSKQEKKDKKHSTKHQNSQQPNEQKEKGPLRRWRVRLNAIHDGTYEPFFQYPGTLTICP